MAQDPTLRFWSSYVVVGGGGAQVEDLFGWVVWVT